MILSALQKLPPVKVKTCSEKFHKIGRKTSLKKTFCGIFRYLFIASQFFHIISNISLQALVIRLNGKT